VGLRPLLDDVATGVADGSLDQQAAALKGRGWTTGGRSARRVSYRSSPRLFAATTRCQSSRPTPAGSGGVSADWYRYGLAGLSRATPTRLTRSAKRASLRGRPSGKRDDEGNPQPARQPEEQLRRGGLLARSGLRALKSPEQALGHVWNCRQSGDRSRTQRLMNDESESDEASPNRSLPAWLWPSPTAGGGHAGAAAIRRPIGATCALPAHRSRCRPAAHARPLEWRRRR